VEVCVFALFALSLGPVEQQLVLAALLVFTFISLAGYAFYKLVHVAHEAWPKFAIACTTCIDFWYDRCEQVVRRRAQLAHLRQEVAVDGVPRRPAA
jgi:hypothetical protein